MKDGIDIAQGIIQGAHITHIRLDEFKTSGEILLQPFKIFFNAFSGEIIQEAHLFPFAD
jgi:hypothetical protein